MIRQGLFPALLDEVVFTVGCFHWLYYFAECSEGDISDFG